MSKTKKKRRHPRSKKNKEHAGSAVRTLENALQLQCAGELDAAKQIYCQIIQQEPGNADAWHLLGMTLYSAGQGEEALECLRQADAFVPDHPQVLANLGAVHHSQGKLDEAREMLERSLRIDPDSVAARNTLGTVMLELSDIESAEQHYERALAIDPTHVSASMNLGNVRQRQGRSRDAEQIYRTVLKQLPGDPLLLANLGEALRQQGKWNEAAEALTDSLKQDSTLTPAAIGLGRTLHASQRLDEAETLFRQVIRHRPDSAKAFHYLGKTLFDSGDFDAAEDAIGQALSLDPGDAYALSTLGFIHVETGKREAAAECFSRAVRLNPDLSEAAGTLLYLKSTDPGCDPEELFEVHRDWGQRYGNVAQLDTTPRDRNQDRRLKIGYVSPDFRHHAVASYLQPVLESHDPNRVEIFCYAEVANPDQVTDRLKANSDHWRFTTGLSDRQVAQQIDDDEIDILIDLAGHTARNRLLVFAHRPAPIQMTWLGYPNTTGLSAIDFRLTCETQDPVGEDSHHVERLLRIPGGSFCFSGPTIAPEVRSAPVLINKHLTFGSLHRPIKITDSVCDLWAAVVNAVPDSRLLIMNTRFSEKSKSGLAKCLVDRGVSQDRFEIRGEYSGESYLEVYHEIDIALDVFPWSGGTTTMEALWMGVPVIAKYGNARSSRSTAAIVKNLGRPEWIAETTDQYIDVVKRMASDPQALQSVRQGLREAVEATIADAKRFTRALEAVYRDAWHQWCD